MAKLEKFVRQVEQTTAPRRIPTAPVADAGPVVLQFGMGAGSTKTETGSYSWSMSFYLEAHRNEPKKQNGFSLLAVSARGILDPETEGEGIYDTQRRTHVKRFFWKDPVTEEKDEEVWVDVQRIDAIEIVLNPERQSYTWIPKWYDKEDRSKENPSHVKVKIKNPDDNEQFVEVTALKISEWAVNPYLPAREFAKEEIDGPEATHFNSNDAWWQGQIEAVFIKMPDDAEAEGEKTLRTEDIRRVIHRDVEAEPDEDGFFQEGAYILVLDEDGGDKLKDRDQYVNFAFPLRVTLRDTPQRLYQINHFNLKQDYLLQFFEPMDPKDAKDEEKKPMWLDPFQNIINVQWGGLAVEFGNKAEDAPE